MRRLSPAAASLAPLAVRVRAWISNRLSAFPRCHVGRLGPDAAIACGFVPAPRARAVGPGTQLMPAQGRRTPGPGVPKSGDGWTPRRSGARTEQGSERGRRPRLEKPGRRIWRAAGAGVAQASAKPPDADAVAVDAVPRSRSYAG